MNRPERLKKLGGLFCLLALLVENGCVASVAPTVPSIPLSQFSDVQLLVYFGLIIRTSNFDKNIEGSIEQEINSRKLLNPEQVAEAINQAIYIGITDSQVLVSIGAPYQIFYNPGDRSVVAWVYNQNINNIIDPDSQAQIQTGTNTSEFYGDVLFMTDGYVVGYQSLGFQVKKRSPNDLLPDIQMGLLTRGHTFYIPEHIPADWTVIQCHDPSDEFAMILTCSFGQTRRGVVKTN